MNDLKYRTYQLSFNRLHEEELGQPFQPRRARLLGHSPKAAHPHLAPRPHKRQRPAPGRRMAPVNAKDADSLVG